MNYPAPPYAVAAPAAKTSTFKIVCIVIAVVVGVFIVIAAIAIALGVGLGVGLKKNSSSSSSSSTSLSIPSVSCTYTGSSTQCGCSATQPSFLSTRIVNGYAAVPNSWPWIVALYINNNTTFCGGSLITYQHVLTAAHCLTGITANTIIAYAGVSTLSTRGSAQARIGSAVNVHPSYSASALTNDIAILTLQSPFNLTTTVSICCLSYDTSQPSTGSSGVIAGWGVTSSSSSTISDSLLQGVIQVQSDSSTCSTSSTSSIRFCAGYNGTDSCYGDSGGPFMSSISNAWTCTGLVSGGVGCGQNGYYTRVTAYQSFITGVING